MFEHLLCEWLELTAHGCFQQAFGARGALVLRLDAVLAAHKLKSEPSRNDLFGPRSCFRSFVIRPLAAFEF